MNENEFNGVSQIYNSTEIEKFFNLDESLKLKRQYVREENEWKKTKAVLEQKIELLQLEVKESKEREENLERLNETILGTLKDLSSENNKASKGVFKELIGKIEENTGEFFNKLENENRELKEKLKDLERKTQINEENFERKKNLLEERILEIENINKEMRSNAKKKKENIELIALEDLNKEIEDLKDIHRREMERLREISNKEMRELKSLYMQEKDLLENKVESLESEIKSYEHKEKHIVEIKKENEILKEKIVNLEKNVKTNKSPINYPNVKNNVFQTPNKIEFSIQSSSASPNAYPIAYEEFIKKKTILTEKSSEKSNEKIDFLPKLQREKLWIEEKLKELENHILNTDYGNDNLIFEKDRLKKQLSKIIYEIENFSSEKNPKRSEEKEHTQKNEIKFLINKLLKAKDKLQKEQSEEKRSENKSFYSETNHFKSKFNVNKSNYK